MQLRSRDIEELVIKYGYLAIFTGTFLEGETILVLGGILASRGLLSLEWVIFSAFIGTLSGDQLFFFMGKFKANKLLERWPSWNQKIERVRIFVRRHSILVIFGFRFLYGLRAVSPFAIGMSHVPIPKFVILNFIGAAFWSVAVGLAGYAFGNALNLFLEHFYKYELVIIVAAVGVATIIWGIARFVLRKKNGKPKVRDP